MRVLSFQLLALFIISAECRDPPQELRAVHLSSTSVFLLWEWREWSNKPIPEQFEVYATTEDAETRVGSVLGKRFFVMEGLLNGTNYNITVAYVTAEGERLRSEELGVRTREGEFLKPTDVRMSKFRLFVDSETYTYGTVWKFDGENPLAENFTGFEVLDCSDDCSRSDVVARGPFELKRNLKCYTNYTVVVSALFEDQEAVGAVLTFETLTGTPREVESLAVNRKPYSVDLNITWSPPERMNGLFKAYEIEIHSLHGATLVKKTLTETTFVYSIENDMLAEEYWITVWARNTNDAGLFPKLGFGRSKNYRLEKPEPPRDLELKSCRPDSIEIEIKSWSEIHLFEYAYAGNQKKRTGTSILLFDGLEPFQEVNVSVSGCFDFRSGGELCGYPKNKTFRTNVDRPSKVRNLKLTVDGAEPILSWETPEKPAGPINGYVVLITDNTRNESSEIVVPNASLEFHFEGVNNCTEYDLAVLAYNADLLSGEEMKGAFSDSIQYLSTNCEDPPGAFPTWAIILIVVAILGAAAGCVVYYLKIRRSSQGRTHGPLLR